MPLTPHAASHDVQIEAFDCMVSVCMSRFYAGGRVALSFAPTVYH